MKVYHQAIILEKINQYLLLHKRALTLNEGYCHGLSLLWLYTMSKNQEHWFYAVIKKIGDCNKPSDYDEIKTDLELFLEQIEWLHNSRKYLKDFNQLDLDKILNVKRHFSLSFLFTEKQLRHIFSEKFIENEMVCLSSNKHTIAIYKKAGAYHLFDANFPEGRSRVFGDLLSLKKQVLTSFFGNIRLNRYPLHINVMNHVHDNQMNSHYFLESFLQKNKKTNQRGYSGATNLCLACECGNEQEVNWLLKAGNNPNQTSAAGNSPLHFAAQGNYSNIVKLLLLHGAKDTLNHDGYTALQLAAAHGNTSTVVILLAQKANPTHPILPKSPLLYALIGKHFDTVIHMLCSMKHIKFFSSQELQLIRGHKEAILFEVNKLSHTLTLNEQKNLNSIFKYCYQQSFLHSIFSSTKKLLSQAGINKPLLSLLNH